MLRARLRSASRLLVGTLAALAVVVGAWAADTPAVRIAYLYDNSAASPGTEPQWGFAALVEARGKRVLFDTGGSADVFRRNIQALKIDLGQLDALVLSHEHWDHTNGIATLGRREGLPAYFPGSAAQAAPFRTALAAAGMEAVPVTEMTSIAPGIAVSHEMKSPMAPEVALMIDTDDGLVVLAGCSHPGADTMLKQIRDLTGRPILMIVGGFHMLDFSADQIRRTLDEFKALGVRYVGPTHCTGGPAITSAFNAFSGAFIQGGVGTVVEAVPFSRRVLP
jgi:7,8-dihydropterin-6-yl-methyl-4-(beta-D-ribofuranosyl)aminobenzene 5'-phosphate synthase